MGASSGVTAEYYRRLLESRFSGRKAILAYGMLANLGKAVALLRELGFEEVFGLAEGTGTGTGDIDFPHRVVGPAGAGSLIESMRGFEAALSRLPVEVTAALDAFDPERQALVFRALWGSVLEVAGRPVYNRRPPAWVALEDKVIIDALWDRVGVARAPSRVVVAEPAALTRAHRELDRGDGTVWAGDAREGWHGGGHLTRWVKRDEHAATAAELLAAHCDRVRVMPFLEGIPCSIHGMVSRDGVAALRPVEMITLRETEAARLHYFGTATLWDPPAADREEMRTLARRVGAALRAEVDYRGTFTIDGVMTADGFRPTELNPRYGAGMYRLAAGCPELPLYFIDAALCHDEPWDFRIAELEELVVRGADATRVPMCSAWDTLPREESETIALARDANGLRRAAPDEAAIGDILAGPSPLGSFYRVRFEPDAMRVGDSIAPSIIEALAFCDRELGTSFGALDGARSVR